MARRWTGPAVLLVVALVLSEVHRGVRFDDPFITYRYAANLAAGRGFVFNPGEATLITTAPLYALILAAVQFLMGVAPHVASPAISMASVWLAAWGLFEYGRKIDARASFAAALCLLCAPLAWLTIGFETPTFMAVSIWALTAARRGSLLTAGILVGAAMGLRGDGALTAAVVGMLLVLQRTPRRGLLRFAVPIFLLYGGLALWLTMQFGTPIPSTLQSKSAQAISGLTGFYAYTSYVEGALILLQAWVSHNPAFLMLPGVAVVGALVILRAGVSRWRQAEWFAEIALPLWALTHVGGYIVLGVAPYVWYYAPLLPGLSWAAGRGLAAASRRVTTSTMRQLVIGAVAVLAATLPAHARAGSVLRGAVPPSPDDASSKTLPETKVDIYERAGRWIAANTAPTATIGMSELGVMAYFADRPAVDFLGLTRPVELADVRHGDFLALVLRELSDFQLLPMRNSVYTTDPQKEEWFQLLYEPVHTLEDARFWGSPLTIWQRRAPVPASMPLPSASAPATLDGWTIESVAANVADLSALPDGRHPLLLRALLRTGPDAGRPGNRLLRMQPVVADGGDGLYVASRQIHTASWLPGEARWVDFPGVVTRPARELAFVVDFSWEDAPQIHAAAAYLPAQPTQTQTDMPMLPLSDGYAVGVLAPRDAQRGQPLSGRLVWRAGRSRLHGQVFVHLRSAAGDIVAQDDHAPRHRGAAFPTQAWQSNCLYEDAFRIDMPADLPPGEYALVVGMYDPSTGLRLAVDEAPHRTADGAVLAARVRLTP